MPKEKSAWTGNPEGENPYIYDQPGVTYDTIYPIYDGVIAQPVNTKEKSAYDGLPKARSGWSANAAAEDDLHPYDENSPYDESDQTYDGLTPGESISTTKKPTQWSNM